MYESTSTYSQLSFFQTQHTILVPFSNVFLASDSYETFSTHVKLNYYLLGGVFHELYLACLTQAEPVKETEKEA